MDNQRENIPENADKLLFAEEIVSYLMTDILNRPYTRTRTTPYREFIHNVFNETVKAAVKGLARSLHLINSNFFSKIKESSDPNETNCLCFEQLVSLRRLSEIFDAKRFLFYCVELAIVASIFRDKGLEGAPDMAVTRISESLRDYDMLSGGWYSLNATASVIAQVYEYTLPPFTTATDNIGVGHRHLSNSSSDGMDLALPDNTHNAAAVEEKKDEDKIPADDCADTFAVHKIMDAEHLHSTCLSTSKEHLQPSDVLQAVMENKIKYENERQDETEKHDADLKGTLNIKENMEVETRQLPSMCERLQDLEISQVQTASNTIRNVELCVVEAEDTSTVDEEADTGYRPKCLDESEEHNYAQIFDSREKCLKTNQSEDRSMLVASGGDSETSGSCQLRGSASEPKLQDDKTRCSDN